MSETGLQMKLQVVMLPVADVDTARDFYVQKVGFNLDHDVQPGDGMRVVQLTPPGSDCSIVMGTGIGEIAQMQPGSIRGLHLVVQDIAQVRDTLISRGVDVTDVVEMQRVKFASFRDPDGNSWVLQEIPADMRG